MEYRIPKGHLSASSLEKLLKCPRQYEYCYVKGMKTPSNKALTLGSVTHAAFMDYYQDVLDDERKIRLTGRQTRELALDFTLPDWFGSNETTITPPERNEIEHAAGDITEGYVDCVGRFTEPKAVEQVMMYQSRCGVPIEAHFDLVRYKNGETSLVDYKITGKAWNKSRLESTLQFMLYAHVTGMRDVQIQNVVAPKPGKRVDMSPDYAKLDAASSGTYNFAAGANLHVFGHRFEENGDWLEDMIESAAKMVTSGLFPPTLPGNWWCSPQWCDYWYLCRGKRG